MYRSINIVALLTIRRRFYSRRIFVVTQILQQLQLSSVTSSLSTLKEYVSVYSSFSTFMVHEYDRNQRPRVHYRVITLCVSISSCCWYELYAEVLRHIFQ
jgi:hypothetical protein